MLFQCLQIVPSRWDHVWDLGWISVTNVSKYFFVDGQCHHFNRSDTTVSIVQKNFRPYPFSLSISFVTLLTWRPLLFWMGLAAILIVQMQLSPSFNFFRPVSVPLFVGPLFKSQWHVTMGSKPLDTHMLLFVYLKYLYQWVLNMGQSFPLCLFTWLGWLMPHKSYGLWSWNLALHMLTQCHCIKVTIFIYFEPWQVQSWFLDS